MERSDFFTFKKPYVLNFSMTDSDFEDYINSCRKEFYDGYVTILRGKRMKNFSSFYQEIAAVLQFPYYFGNNWNALIECIQDLLWINKNYFLLGIDAADLILAEETRDDYSAFIDLLDRTASFFSSPYEENKPWGRKAKPFHVILNYSAKVTDATLRCSTGRCPQR
jgi:RNAse (barnase) inhibitor barstar